MANDKDFILKNAVEVGGPTNVTLGTVTSDNIDLSTGNYFKDTPTGTSTYTISNAGDVQSFQLEVTGGTAEVAQNFNITALDSVSFGDTITTGVDLSTDGGLIWLKKRDDSYNWHLIDTVRGAGKYISSSNSSAQATDNDRIKAFNTDGFLLGSDVQSANGKMVYYSFKKAAGFFDIVTYSGSASDQNISHNLGTTPGMIIIKSYDQAYDWGVRHRSLDSGNNMILNGRSGEGANGWFPSDPTSTQFTVKGGVSAINTSGANYIAYLFAHDTADDSLIKCGSYTGNGSTSGPTVTLGWQPQFLMIKNVDTTGDWIVHDVKRGMAAGIDDVYVEWNSTDVEAGGAERVSPTSTGFQIVTNGSFWNSSGVPYIYMAIREASEPAITWPSSIEWAGGVAPAAPAVGETDVFTISTDDGGTSYVGVKTADNLS